MIFISQTLEISKEKLKHKTFLMGDTATEVIVHIKYRHIIYMLARAFFLTLNNF